MLERAASKAADFTAFDHAGVVLVAMALFLVLNAATALYVPTYLQYVDGCVAPPRNGTFFATLTLSLTLTLTLTLTLALARS